MKQMDIQNAVQALTKAMQEDPDYAYGWHCNIAMMCYDAMGSKLYDDPAGFDHERAHLIGNDAASRFMKLAFGVETQLK